MWQMVRDWPNPSRRSLHPQVLAMATTVEPKASRNEEASPELELDLRNQLSNRFQLLGSNGEPTMTTRYETRTSPISTYTWVCWDTTLNWFIYGSRNEQDVRAFTDRMNLPQPPIPVSPSEAP